MKRKQWEIRIPAGEWMAGVHRFKTKKAALTFQASWAEANRCMTGGTLRLIAIREC